jgi:hypothetical protein
MCQRCPYKVLQCSSLAKTAAAAVVTSVEDSDEQVGEETRKKAEPRSPGISGGSQELRGSLEPHSST